MIDFLAVGRWVGFRQVGSFAGWREGAGGSGDGVIEHLGSRRQWIFQPAELEVALGLEVVAEVVLRGEPRLPSSVTGPRDSLPVSREKMMRRVELM